MLNEPIHKDPSSLEAQLEKLAEAFDSRDFPFAAICLKKILGKLGPAPEQDEATRAFSTDVQAELQKAINAIDGKDFPLAAACSRKALEQMTLDPAVKENATIFVSSLDTEDFSTAADAIRHIRKAAGLAGKPPGLE